MNHATFHVKISVIDIYLKEKYMKKWIVLLLLATLILSACGKSEEKVSLENDIKQLEKENKDLKNEKNNLEKQKEKLNAQREKLQKEVDSSVAKESVKQETEKSKRITQIKRIYQMKVLVVLKNKVVTQIVNNQVIIQALGRLQRATNIDFKRLQVWR